MSEDLFSKEDRESLIQWIENRGGNRQQAEFAARQMMKRAAIMAEKEGVAPIEAMGRLLTKVAEAERVFSENSGMDFTENMGNLPKNRP
tara:strand:+ start:5425 stop:5691 length:267 start_codon:yes stop_codon:yes gene_type:complete